MLRMPDPPNLAYTVVWTPRATVELQGIDRDDAINVLNNTMALARTPHPPFSGELPGHEGMYALMVGPMSITYEVLGLTVRILGVASIKTGT